MSTAHPQIAFLRLLDRQALPANFVADIERWRTRSGTVKINVALDRLPEFASKPGLDPQVHGGTIVLAESVDDIEGAYQEAVNGRPASLPFADICIPSVFDDSLAPKGRQVMSMFTQWVPHTWNSEPHRGELETYADRVFARMDDVAALPSGFRHARRRRGDWHIRPQCGSADSCRAAASQPGRRLARRLARPGAQVKR